MYFLNTPHVSESKLQKKKKKAVALIPVIQCTLELWSSERSNIVYLDLFPPIVGDHIFKLQQPEKCKIIQLKITLCSFPDKSQMSV